MSLFGYRNELSPGTALLRLQEAVDRAFERPWGLDLGVSGRGVEPPVNVFRDDEGLVFHVTVPGVDPADIDVTASARTLRISAKVAEDVPEGASYHRRERFAGEFSRSFQLPDDVDPDGIEARYERGILKVRLPKRAEVRPRQIEVRTV